MSNTVYIVLWVVPYETRQITMCFSELEAAANFAREQNEKEGGGGTHDEVEEWEVK